MSSQLAIGCGDSRCGPKTAPADRRHAFIPIQDTLPGLAGACESCGETGLVDFERCHLRDPNDLAHLEAAMRLELIRDNYWSLALPDRIIRNARRRTSEQLNASARALLASALVPAHVREGHQTRFAETTGATIVHCAQHATGTCCRACLSKWHGVPRTEPLGDRDLDYLQLVTFDYIERRLQNAPPETVEVSHAA